MSSPNEIPAAVVDHPSWCSRAHCDADRGHADVRHRSAPVAWTAAQDDATLQMALYRDDQLDRDGRVVSQQHGVLLGVQHLAFGHADGTLEQGQVLLSEPDVTRLEREFARFRRMAQG